MLELINSLKRLMDLEGEEGSKESLNCIITYADNVDDFINKIEDEISYAIDSE